MSANSKIEWTDHTFNPWIGCTEVSKAATGGGGCDGCYAKVSTPARVLRAKGIETWGPHAARHRTSPANWKMPVRWNAEADAFMAQHGRRQRVFCASLADVFDNAVDPVWRVELFALIRATPNVDWLLLTKRIGNVRNLLAETQNAAYERVDYDLAAFLGSMVNGDTPPANIWLGATIVNQEEADRDIPKLLSVPARVRFLSMEPLLGPVDLTAIPISGHGHHEFEPIITANVLKRAKQYPPLPQVDWVIVGGESGPGARPMHPDWARSLRVQCQAAGVPFLFKQWGEWIEPDIDGMPVRLTAREGDPEFYEAASKVDGFLCVDGRFASDVDDLELDVRYLGMNRIGKKAAGRLLDGRTWDEVPA